MPPARRRACATARRPAGAFPIAGDIMIFRPATEPDLAGLMPLLVPDPASPLTAEHYQSRSHRHEYRPEWTWLAQDDADASPATLPAAVAVFWGDPRAARPAALDGVFLRDPGPHAGRAARAGRPNRAHRADQADQADQASLAAGLLTAAYRAFATAGTDQPPYHLFLPPDWHDRPDVAEALAWREEAARRAGLTERLERLQYKWTPAAGLKEPSGRLSFRAEPDDEIFTALFRAVLAGTLDATSGQGVRAIGLDAQARKDLAFYRDSIHGQRSWWRVAQTPGGQVAGFGIPSRNTENPVVGYLGVLPEHRGHRYADEILAEITRILAVEAGATRIRADTDLGNRPMAAAFDRMGYRITGRRLVLSARARG
jgi:ribosomal protein S18 acetylase RimI-like enzyme